MHPRSVCSFGTAPWALVIRVRARVTVLVTAVALAVIFDRRFRKPSVMCLLASSLCVGLYVAVTMELGLICELLGRRILMATCGLIRC